MNPNTDVMSPYLKIKKLVEGDDEEEEEERGSGVKVNVNVKKKRPSLGEGVSGMKGGGGGAAPPPPCCVVESCRVTLGGCKKYYQRHRVCEVHGKAPVVLIDGLKQRFCQQCSRFHELSEFDNAKRSCRRRLAGHNERRRKNSLESQKNGTRSDGNKGFDICYKSP